MDFLEKLDEAIKLPNVYYHNFISSFKKNSTDIYAFCEGDVDLSYYGEQIERLCPGTIIHKCPVQCKNNVIEVWRYIDWNIYQKNRVLFFVDRDLSYWVGEPQFYDTNVYITDGYSFENDGVNCSMFLKLLEDLYGFANYTDSEKNDIKEFYLNKWDKFVEGSYKLMGFILYKYQTSKKHLASNIPFKKCLCIGTEDVWKGQIEGVKCEEYYKTKLELFEEDLSEEIDEIKKRFMFDGGHYSIRGKWCLEFMIDSLEYVIDSGKLFAPSLYGGKMKEPKRIMELTSRGAMAVIGPKIVPPESLKDFLSLNLGKNYA